MLRVFFLSSFFLQLDKKQKLSEIIVVIMMRFKLKINIPDLRCCRRLCDLLVYLMLDNVCWEPRFFAEFVSEVM